MSKPGRADVLVIGLGNPLMADDGLGLVALGGGHGLPQLGARNGVCLLRCIWSMAEPGG